MDRLQINATRMPSYCHSGESCSICFQPLVEKFRCIDCLKNQVCKLCLLTAHSRPHLHIFEGWKAFCADNCLKNWHIPVDWVDSFSHWIWRHNSTLRVCKGFPINFMTMGRKSQYNMASWFITLTSRCTSLSIVHRRCNVFYVEWIL